VIEQYHSRTIGLKHDTHTLTMSSVDLRSHFPAAKERETEGEKGAKRTEGMGEPPEINFWL